MAEFDDGKGAGKPLSRSSSVVLTIVGLFRYEHFHVGEDDALPLLSYWSSLELCSFIFIREQSNFLEYVRLVPKLLFDQLAQHCMSVSRMIVSWKSYDFGRFAS